MHLAKRPIRTIEFIELFPELCPISVKVGSACDNQKRELVNDLVGTVWLVDDDSAVLRMLQSLVDSLNVDVQAFSNAKDFLAAYRARPMECLVCDLRMPDMDGIEVQKQLKARGTPLPIIFLTGFAEVEVAVQAMRDGALDFVQKPFSARAMLSKIQSIFNHLDRSQVSCRKK